MPLDATNQDGVVPSFETLIEVNQDGMHLGLGHSAFIEGILKVEVRSPGTAAAGGVADTVALAGVSAQPSADGATLVANALTQEVEISSTGKILVDTSVGPNPAYGIFESFAPHVVNQGVIFVTGGASATGVFIVDVETDTGTLVSNIGSIQVTSFTGVATGVQAQGQHDVFNSGEIDAKGFTATVGALVGPGTAFNNTGHITATDMLGATGAVAVEYAPSQAWSFTNSGTLTGDFSLKALTGFPSPPVGAVIANSGQMNGLVVLGGGGDLLTNSGSIIGAINLGDGDDTISGGTGADLFHGSQDAGIDRVLDFHLSEGDRVMLDPGTTYTVSQVGADTVIDMGAINGQPNQMILMGVQMSSLTPGWIFGA